LALACKLPASAQLQVLQLLFNQKGFNWKLISINMTLSKLNAATLMLVLCAVRTVPKKKSSPPKT
jgi:hypothetical protein